LILRIGDIRLSDDVVAEGEDLLQYAINIFLKHLRQAGGVAGVEEEGFDLRGTGGAAIGCCRFGDAQAVVVVAVLGEGFRIIRDAIGARLRITPDHADSACHSRLGKLRFRLACHVSA